MSKYGLFSKWGNSKAIRVYPTKEAAEIALLDSFPLKERDNYKIKEVTDDYDQKMYIEYVIKYSLDDYEIIESYVRKVYSYGRNWKPVIDSISEHHTFGNYLYLTIKAYSYDEAEKMAIIEISKHLNKDGEVVPDQSGGPGKISI